MAEYFYISLFAVVALVVIGALLALSTLLGPRNATPQKLLPYECGIVPAEEAKGRYPVRFATIAMPVSNTHLRANETRHALE